MSEKVGIIGSGLIGKSWAMLFAGAGFQVVLYDTVPAQIEAAMSDVKNQLHELEATGMLRGQGSAAQQLALISGCNLMQDCIKDAVHVQECVPENLDLKKALWGTIDSFADTAKPEVTLASSTSCIMPSRFSEALTHRNKVLVAHPVNPPYYVPLVELVPSPWTDPEVMGRARALMEKIGQSPVTLSKELPGFALNRIQYAILNECWKLVSDGVLTVADVDTVMTDGLGPRYAFLGPLETAHLNAEGMADYCNRYGETIYNVSNTLGPVPRMGGASAENVHKQLCEKFSVEKLPERRQWRDKMLTALAKLKIDMKKNTDAIGSTGELKEVKFPELRPSELEKVKFPVRRPSDIALDGYTAFLALMQTKKSKIDVLTIALSILNPDATTFALANPEQFPGIDAMREDVGPTLTEVWNSTEQETKLAKELDGAVALLAYIIFTGKQPIAENNGYVKVIQNRVRAMEGKNNTRFSNWLPNLVDLKDIHRKSTLCVGIRRFVYVSFLKPGIPAKSLLAVIQEECRMIIKGVNMTSYYQMKEFIVAPKTLAHVDTSVMAEIDCFRQASEAYEDSCGNDSVVVKHARYLDLGDLSWMNKNHFRNLAEASYYYALMDGKTSPSQKNPIKNGRGPQYWASKVSELLEPSTQFDEEAAIKDGIDPVVFREAIKACEEAERIMRRRAVFANNRFYRYPPKIWVRSQA